MITTKKVGAKPMIFIVKKCDNCKAEVGDLYSFNSENGEVEVFEHGLWIAKATPLQLCEDCLKKMSIIKTANVEVAL